MFGHRCFAKTACNGSHSWKVRLYVFTTPKYKGYEQKSVLVCNFQWFFSVL